jgi:hypothetical protein
MNNSAGEFSTDYYEDFSIGLDTLHALNLLNEFTQNT